MACLANKMNNDYNEVMKKTKGFTLIELLVVITIISILTIITVAQFQTAQKKANDVARKGDINALTKALQMYYADYEKFPTSSTTGTLIVAGDNIAWGGQFADKSNPPYVYMKTLPMEKKSTNPPYCYVTDNEGKKFAIFAMLENTADNECKVNASKQGSYSHCGQRYCYAAVSANATVSDLDSFVP